MRLTKSGGLRRFWDEYHDNCCAGRADSDHNYVVVGEMGMFEAVPTSGRKRWSSSMVLSFAAHLLSSSAHCFTDLAPAFVTPSDVGLGIPHSMGSQPDRLFGAGRPEQAKPAPTEPKLALRAKLSPKPKPPKPEPKREEAAASTAADAPLQTARGGSLFGHVPGSPLTGDEVRSGVSRDFPRSSYLARRPAVGSSGRCDRRNHHRPAGQCG